MAKKRNPHEGSTFESWLQEEGFLEDATEKAVREVIVWQLTREMKRRRITKADMARRMATSRSQLDRLLDPRGASVTLATLAKAARAVGKKLRVEIVEG
ncbi:MAG: helix-turn-helix domain-containing protein [Alphaproteobacteria bacterium]